MKKKIAAVSRRAEGTLIRGTTSYEVVKLEWNSRHAYAKKVWAAQNGFISVWEKRIRRQISWHFDGKSYTNSRQEDKLPFRVKKHQSKLLKKLGDSDMILQYNKIKNLEIVVGKRLGHPSAVDAVLERVPPLKLAEFGRVGAVGRRVALLLTRLEKEICIY